CIEQHLQLVVLCRKTGKFSLGRLHGGKHCFQCFLQPLLHTERLLGLVNDPIHSGIRDEKLKYGDQKKSREPHGHDQFEKGERPFLSTAAAQPSPSRANVARLTQLGSHPGASAGITLRIVRSAIRIPTHASPPMSPEANNTPRSWLSSPLVFRLTY